MMDRQELMSFVGGLTRQDRALVMGIGVLIELSDDSGSVGRVRWMSQMERIYASGGGALGAGVTDTSDDDANAFRRFLEDKVLLPLEHRGIAVREPAGEDWELLRVAPDLWESIADDRAGAAMGLEAVARSLQEASGPRLAEAGRASALLEDGSRFYGEGLTKIYRKRKVVNEADISVRQGEIVGLLGPNGAGKTTTFYMMVGLIPPNEGKVFLDGEDLTKVPMFQRARRGVGYLAQEPSVFRKLTVEENVLAILETLKLPKAERKARLEELLDELSLSHLRDNKAYSLSGGERRRLEITRALVQRPKFMLLDEPFAGIDPIAVNDIQEIVSGLRHRGIGVIISDHNVEQTLEIVDRAYIMYEGRIRVSGTVSELVWNDEVAEIYLGPTLTSRMRQRYSRPTAAV
jgi:lipopolysaccharide export system ATP-binding protein